MELEYSLHGEYPNSLMNVGRKFPIDAVTMPIMPLQMMKHQHFRFNKAIKICLP